MSTALCMPSVPDQSKVMSRGEQPDSLSPWRSALISLRESRAPIYVKQYTLVELLPVVLSQARSKDAWRARRPETTADTAGTLEQRLQALAALRLREPLGWRVTGRLVEANSASGKHRIQLKKVCVQANTVFHRSIPDQSRHSVTKTDGLQIGLIVSQAALNRCFRVPSVPPAQVRMGAFPHFHFHRSTGTS